MYNCVGCGKEYPVGMVCPGCGSGADAVRQKEEAERVHNLETSNAAPKAEIEKYKKALDEIIMWSNEPHSKLDMPKINDIARQARKE